MSEQCMAMLDGYQCIYVDGHGGEHNAPQDGQDHSDEIRIQVLRDDRDRLRAKLEADPPMISAKAANIVFREKERYKAALELIAAESNDPRDCGVCGGSSEGREATMTPDQLAEIDVRLTKFYALPGGPTLIARELRAEVERLAAENAELRKALRDLRHPLGRQATAQGASGAEEK